MAKYAPWTEAVRELMKDRQWHTRNEILALGGRSVPPGRAMRRWEVNRKRDWVKRGGTKDNMPPAFTSKYSRATEESAIEAGRRAIVQDSLSGLIESGWAEGRRLNGTDEFRLRDIKAAINARGLPTREQNLTQRKLQSLLLAAANVVEADQTPKVLADQLLPVIDACQKLLEGAPNLRRLGAEERRRAYADTRLGK